MNVRCSSMRFVHCGSLLAMALILSLGSARAADLAFDDPAVQIAGMKRGLDVAWLPPWLPPSAPQVRDGHFAVIRAAGFDTVQLVLTPFAHMGPDLALDHAWLAGLDRLTKAALSSGLTVVLLEHDDAGCARDAVLCRQKIDAFWYQIGARYRESSPQLLFGVTFEPGDAFTAPAWNGELSKTLAVIRQTNPGRNVLVGIQMHAGTDQLAEFALPPSDRHLIAVAHYFQPLCFTHQGADWEPAAKGCKDVAWGSSADRARLEHDFAAYRAWGLAHHRPMVLGAFGAFETAPAGDRLRWIEAVARTAEANQMPWAFWQFDTNFNVYDLSKDEWLSPVLHALIPPKP
jgi:endoglucanase